MTLTITWGGVLWTLVGALVFTVIYEIGYSARISARVKRLEARAREELILTSDRIETWQAVIAATERKATAAEEQVGELTKHMLDMASTLKQLVREQAGLPVDETSATPIEQSQPIVNVVDEDEEEEPATVDELLLAIKSQTPSGA